MEDCLFCKIVRQEIKARLIYEDPDVVAFDDINPQAPVHSLLIPRKHVSSLNNVAEGDELLLGKVLLAAQKLAAEKGIHQKGYRLVINTNAEAGQTVFHLHVHLLGGRSMHWPPG
jgi:histidine triad (HIT) family protein